jgi:hypothetical protein
MRASLVRTATVVAAVGTAVALAAPAASADEGHREVQQVVDVSGDGSAVHLDHPRVAAGSIRFRVHTTNPSGPDGGGSQITMFRPKSGVSVDAVLADAAEESGQDPAQGTRDLVRDATFYGLADVVMGTPATVTETLAPGAYHLLDLGSAPQGPPTVTTLTVGPAEAGIEQDSDLRARSP